MNIFLKAIIGAILDRLTRFIDTWLYGAAKKAEGRAEAALEGAIIRDKQEAEAKVAGDEAKKDHAMKPDDSAFDSEFRRD